MGDEVVHNLMEDSIAEMQGMPTTFDFEQLHDTVFFQAFGAQVGGCAD